MIFSSHRFGNLTRHADIILFVPSFIEEMSDSDQTFQIHGPFPNFRGRNSRRTAQAGWTLRRIMEDPSGRIPMI